ncbi:MAG: rhodanese-like domain-containing protein [Bdellovibrionaceae bacterium]|nr:rhodanese-like domain-containing protein [Pseudobdellovibrionaceae bacterium]
MLKTQQIHGITEVHPKDLKDHLKSVQLIDVRRPDEFTGELGHIAGSKLVTLGPELEAHMKTLSKEDPIVFICRSGGRSGHATMFSQDMGFKSVMNMTGGMILWNELGFPTEK